MSEALNNQSGFIQVLRKYRGAILPLAAASMILVILVPLPPALMDVLLACNIAFSALILLTAIYVSTPLEFSVFPSVLLGATLFRLVLNVASTRLILTAGVSGDGPAGAQFAAGHVIWSFSRFVTSGSLAVGVIIFAIIVVVQFVVVTRGAARISEVGARFVLDAMPGKQMAIDADLNSSLITQDEARRRREEITTQADFYGAMDGASKFLRGDAVAAVIIILVNILGGLYVGMMQHGWGWTETIALFSRLTIGDGLVTQIPAFIVSVSAALIVSRSTASTSLGEEMLGQLTSRPAALVITAIFLAVLTMTSLPVLPLLMLSGICLVTAAVMFARRQQEEDTREAIRQTPQKETSNVDRLLKVDPLNVELGFALISIAQDEGGGSLVGRISETRNNIAEQLGLVMPQVRVCDNMTLSPYEYVIKVRGAAVGCGRAYPNKLLAVADSTPSGRLNGRDDHEPATGTPSVWIDTRQQGRAAAMNYTVKTAAEVIAAHLDKLVRRHADELLMRQQVLRMIEAVGQTQPDLHQEAVSVVRTATVYKVMCGLLREGVPIHETETILQCICEQAEAGAAGDIDRLVETVRSELGQTVWRRYCGRDGRLWCVNLHEELDEAAIAECSERSGEILHRIQNGLYELQSKGCRPVVICGAGVRGTVRKMLSREHPEAAVLTYGEVDSMDVNPVATVSSDK